MEARSTLRLVQLKLKKSETNYFINGIVFNSALFDSSINRRKISPSTTNGIEISIICLPSTNVIRFESKILPETLMN